MLGKLIKTKSLISIICLFFLMGCAYHTGNISTGSYIDCPLLRLETGTAKATIFFGIGGLSKDALILEAKKNLISKINFKNNLKITNYTVDYKNTYFLFYHSNTVTVSAEIYNCGGEIETQTPKLDSNFSLSPIINGFRLKDSVIFINQNI